tara:strand:- start:483 stop:2639 length:2157 start_codon:yes stop_codon:yes gene_type:complete
MPLQKIQLNPGINREITKYTNEAGWHDGDKIRFRQGYPEKIGGWRKINDNTFTGVCRSLHQWVDLNSNVYIGVGTNVKFYIEGAGAYNDVTPERSTATLLTDPFNVTDGSAVITVTHASHGAESGAYVTITDVPGNFNGIVAAELNDKEHFITKVDNNTYTITVTTAATSSDTTAGGAGVKAAYQINPGPALVVPTQGWSSLEWDEAGWNEGSGGVENLRVWSQANFGEDLILGPRSGEIYYWDASEGSPLTKRAKAVKNVNNGTAITLASNPFATVSTSPTVTVTDATLSRVYEVGQHVTFANAGTVNNIPLNGRFKIQTVDSAANTFTITGGTNANSTSTGGGGSVTAQYEVSAEVPVVQDMLLVSDSSRFVFAFGCNAFGDATEARNPLLIRWSDQEDMFDWRPRSTNQSGDLQLSQGTKIMTAIQSRQEILVFTDSSLYSLQYVGAPVVWSSQLVGSNISIASTKAAAHANGVTYWMGKGKFYKYDGSVQALRCDVRKYIFDDLDAGQYGQVFAGTLEEYHEVWWFYCSEERVAPDKYVVYNYIEDVWYYGTLDRSAWLDSTINDFPLAATESYNLVEHENGLDNNQNVASAAINAYVTSGQFGIESGDSFTFVDKVIPDIQFLGSASDGDITTTLSILGASESGSANNNPLSEGGNSGGSVVTSGAVDQYTEELDVRVRGRQMAIKVESNTTGVKWQLGTIRLRMRPDGRRGK